MPRCKLCKDKFTPKYFLQKHCMEKDECIKAEIELKKATIWKEKRAEMKVNTHSKEYKKEFQNEINKLSRNIDVKFGFNACIDCGKLFENHQIDACHLISKGSNSTLSYNLHNLHSGHNHCNFYNPTHESNYKKGLVLRYGIEYLQMIENMPLKYTSIHLSNQEIHDKLTLVRKINRTFNTYQLSDGVSSRGMFNILIGIYK